MKYTWLVEKYLEGELSGEALHRFELEILRNPEAARELERIRAMNRFMREQHVKLKGDAELDEDFEDLENTLSEQEVRAELEGLKVRKLSPENHFHKQLVTRLTESRSRYQLREQQSDKVLIRRLSLASVVAAMAILLLATGLLLQGRNQIPDHLALYELHFVPQEADPAYRTDGQSRSSALREALNVYNKKAYARAFRLFQSVPPAERVHEYYLFKGITAMQLGEFEMAIELLGHLDSEPVYRHDSYWYRALCYLGMGKIESARQTCREIIEADLYYKNQAKKLLRKL